MIVKLAEKIEEYFNQFGLFEKSEIDETLRDFAEKHPEEARGGLFLLSESLNNYLMEIEKKKEEELEREADEMDKFYAKYGI